MERYKQKRVRHINEERVTVRMRRKVVEIKIRLPIRKLVNLLRRGKHID
jgi:hypothetical protein